MVSFLSSPWLAMSADLAASGGDPFARFESSKAVHCRR